MRETTQLLWHKIVMTADLSRDAFIKTLQKSRLLDSQMIDRVAQDYASATARELAEILIRSGKLTHYQSEKLLRGTWRGLLIGPYRILAPLGRGGMGTVYLARDSRPAAENADEPLVALKVLPSRVAREEERQLERFRRELELGRKTSHPNVARTLAGGEVDQVHFIAMEYVPGRTLRDIVETDGRLSVGEAARIFAYIASGLTHLHERGMIHRDLKPANIMVTPTGEAKILDLGLSLIPFDPRTFDPMVVGGKGYILGTMDYISPEQARDATNVTPRSDLYSLGCSLYYALTGSPPFPGGTSLDKIRWQQSQKPAAVGELNAAVPAEFSKLVDMLMTKEPSGRPPSAHAVKELLGAWAAAPAKVSVPSYQEAVETVDRPDPHPRLWFNDSTSEAETMTEEGGPVADTPHWPLVAGVAIFFLALMFILSILRGL